MENIECNIIKIFEYFKNRIEFRFQSEILWQKKNNSPNIYLESEDSIRYTFFNLLIRENLFPAESCKMEYPHLDFNPKKKMDMVVLDDELNPILVFEFKLNWGNVGGQTRRAGHLFADFFRLMNFLPSSDIPRLFIHITNNTMDNYFRENSKTYNLPMTSGEEYRYTKDFFKNTEPTFYWHAASGLLPLHFTKAINSKQDNEQHYQQCSDLISNLNFSMKVKCLKKYEIEQPNTFLYLYNIIPEN